MNARTSAFVHRFKPPATPASAVLLMLHGTGGNEDDLLPLARLLSPDSGVLSPRGKVLERGMPRFFRRLAEGVFDVDDLRRRAAELAEFVAEAATEYSFDARRIVGVGFSNGANIAASLLLLHPGTLAAAILFRAMVPVVPEPLPSLPRTPVFLSNGRYDPLVAEAETERLADLLRSAGAGVTLAWQESGHELTGADVAAARDWLTSVRL
jgi:predicted esterase